MGAWEEAAAGSPGSKTVIKHLRLGAQRAQGDGRLPHSLKPSFFFFFWTSCGLSIAVSFAALKSTQKALGEPTQQTHRPSGLPPGPRPQIPPGVPRPEQPQWSL